MLLRDMNDSNNNMGRYSIRLFLMLCLYRILNALLIRTQFDADEYWQTLEPAYCQVFPSCALTWEWTRRLGNHTHLNHTILKQSLHGPIRSYLPVLPTYIFYKLAKYSHYDTWWVVSKGPMLVHAILIAAPTDYATYYIAHHLGGPNHANWTLYFSICSWFHAYALIRTYSNSMETMLLLVGMALVTPELFPTHQGTTTTTTQPSSRRRRRRAVVAFVLGGMSVAIRFTSLAAWIPMGIIIAIGTQKNKMQSIQYLIFPCALCGLLGIGISLIVDFFMYGFWVIPFLGNFHFNVIQGYGSLYGIHSWHWYWTAGLPAISGLLLPLVVLSLLQVSRTKSNHSYSIWIIIGSYTFLHSYSAHKEFRFLLPILPLLCIQAASVISPPLQALQRHSPTQQLQQLQQCGSVIYMIVNFGAVFYLGWIHQAGPIALQRGLMQHISRSVIPSPSTFHRTITVHYWMSCHSTPLYSHLHTIMTSTSIEMTAWYLDCSPDCRIRGDCESDSFQSDPRGFIKNHYNSLVVSTEEQSCLIETIPTGITATPEYIAISSNHEMVLQEELERRNMVEVGRYPHTIQNVEITSGWNVRITFEDFVLYHNKETMIEMI
jgi:GPI mannosyltransferase 3